MYLSESDNDIMTQLYNTNKGSWVMYPFLLTDVSL